MKSMVNDRVKLGIDKKWGTVGVLHGIHYKILPATRGDVGNYLVALGNKPVETNLGDIFPTYRNLDAGDRKHLGV